MAINRYELVKRHNPKVGSFMTDSPLTVGNGEFAFTADATGLQTFPELYEEIPLCTMAQWGWHSYPLPQGMNPESLKLELLDTYGRKVPYKTSSEGQSELFDTLRTSPHKLHLGRVGLHITLEDGRRAQPENIKEVEQVLDLWRGVLVSRFTVEGVPVEVKTCCHPVEDMLAVSVQSKLTGSGRIRVSFDFPYGSHEMNAADWEHPEKHETRVVDCKNDRIGWLRQLDHDRYFCRARFSNGAAMIQNGKHSFLLEDCAGEGHIELVCAFTQAPGREELPLYSEVLAVSEKHWVEFWSTGGAIELSRSTDPRALELERRIVLSQYLTAIQCAGTLPPAETGLTCNSWYGKYHLEMHYWHAAHFALWGREKLLERSMWWYDSIREKAADTARLQGYEGIRWPKMVGPDGIDSPSPIGPLLIWQQPHPIMYSELLYRTCPDPATLERYKDIVFDTAEFMASYAVYDNKRDRYVLGPPLIPAQENHWYGSTINPAYELEYWVWGLDTAQKWRERLGRAREPKWDEIICKISPLAVENELYAAHENCPDTFEKFNYDHPSMLCAMGVMPGRLVDAEIMRNTLKRVMQDWKWAEAWGWDFPVAAMTAARLGEPGLAIDCLLLDAPKNRYLNNGHNWHWSGLPLYLPGNGALLLAAAMMCAGWDGAEQNNTPGFPQDGTWQVQWEGLARYI